MAFSTKIKKIKNWEHWPSPLFYIPILPYYFKCAYQAKSLTFILNTNPAIKYSGHGMESKYDVLQLFPKNLIPKTIKVHPNSSLKSILYYLKNEQINFPIIAKPDIGFRGLLVKKINTPSDLQSYINTIDVDILLQEWIDFPNECGLFYTRIPGEKKGTITSLTLKKFLKVYGDGRSSLEELILREERASIYLDVLKKIHKENIYKIPEKDKEITLTVIGNHSKGTQFLNGNHLINEELIESFNTLNNNSKGWYYGRLDIKYHNFEDLILGKNYKILELNGILAEPTHIYDASIPNASYISAVKTIKEHWRIINKIATINNKSKKHKCISLKEYLKEVAWLYKHSKHLTKLSESI